MASSVTSVIPSGYLSSDAYSSLSTAQQKAATGAQALLNSQYALATQGLTSSGSILNLGTTTTATTQGGAAAQTGISGQQNALAELALSGTGSDATSGGLSISNIAQLSVLTALTQRGVTLGAATSTDSTSSASDSTDAIAAAKATQANSQASIIGSALGSLTGDSSTASVVSAYYGQKAASEIGSLYSGTA